MTGRQFTAGGPPGFWGQLEDVSDGGEVVFRCGVTPSTTEIVKNGIVLATVRTKDLVPRCQCGCED